MQADSHAVPDIGVNSRRIHCVRGVLLLVFTAVVLRAAAAMNDLWLDEIWSLLLIGRGASAPWDLVRGDMRHDNNHLLNSLYLFWLPAHLPPLTYRFASVVAGAAAVVPAWFIGRQRSVSSAWWCAIALVTSHIAVNCSSEARGYGLMSLFLLISQWTALEAFESCQPSTGKAHCWLPAVFGCACVLGLLSHLSFVMAYLGMLGWTVWIIAWKPVSRLRKLCTVCAWHAVPLTFVGLLYTGFVRGMVYGGGPRQTLPITIVKGLAALSGATQDLPTAVPIAGGVALVAVICLVGCFRDRPRRAAFFLIGILLAPAAILVVFPINFYSVRYLLVPLQTVLVLMASELAVVASVKNGVLPRLTVAVGVIVTAANLARDAVLIHRGRGEYRRMLRVVKEAAIANRAPGITLTSNHDLRTHLLVAYHQEGLPGPPIRAFTARELPAAGADWFIVNHMGDNERTPSAVTDRHGNTYRHAASTLSGGLSKTHWHLYRRASVR